jgi:hypothetical protein
MNDRSITTSGFFLTSFSPAFVCFPCHISFCFSNSSAAPRLSLCQMESLYPSPQHRSLLPIQSQRMRQFRLSQLLQFRSQHFPSQATAMILPPVPINPACGPCAIGSVGPCQNADGACFAYRDEVNQLCWPGSFDCNKVPVTDAPTKLPTGRPSARIEHTFDFR